MSQLRKDNFLQRLQEICRMFADDSRCQHIFSSRVSHYAFVGLLVSLLLLPLSLHTSFPCAVNRGHRISCPYLFIRLFLLTFVSNEFCWLVGLASFRFGADSVPAGVSRDDFEFVAARTSEGAPLCRNSEGPL